MPGIHVLLSHKDVDGRDKPGHDAKSTVQQEDYACGCGSSPPASGGRAEEVIRDGVADMVALTRAQIADPDLAVKLREGRADGIRHCIRLNQGCLGRGSRGLAMSCTVNPQVGLEQERAERPAASTAQRWVVVGGGPAGMRAAVELATDGHAVTLFERERALGGQLRLARAVPGRDSIDLLVGDLRRDLMRAGVDVRLGVEATSALVRGERPDGIVLATGAVAPRGTSLAMGGAYAGGFPVSGTVDAFSAVADPAALGRRIAVIDGDGTAYASGIVLTLLEAVGELTLITPFETAFPHVGAGYDRPLLFERLAGHPGFERMVSQRIDRVGPAELELSDVVTGRRVAPRPTRHDRRDRTARGRHDPQTPKRRPPRHSDRHDRRRLLAAHDRRGDLRGRGARLRRRRDGNPAGLTQMTIVLDLPFRGRWRAEMSPGRRVPSHGTDLFGITYAIDFVGVDDRGRSAPPTRRLSEPADSFVGFGRPISHRPRGSSSRSTTANSITSAADGARAHPVPARSGRPGARGHRRDRRQSRHHRRLATGPFIGLVHLRQGSVRVGIGDVVSIADPLAECGNSGNSTEPCLHVQVTDSTDWSLARGIPIVFRAYRSVGTGATVQNGLPGEREIIEPPDVLDRAWLR